MAKKALHTQWSDLLENQTKESFKSFWSEYSECEEKIYADLLSASNLTLKGTVEELSSKYKVKPVFFMGFLDGINSSIEKEMDLDSIDESSEIDITAISEKLYFNMLEADAEHLYTLPEWEDVLNEDERNQIETEYRRSRTVVKEKLPGRNDPCPCGSGKKYKKCCGA